MKNLLLISIIASIAIGQQTTSYSWEDGTGTILGSYGNLSDPANVGTTSGISPYDGNRMLTISESPIDGTPQAFIAWITDLSAGQDITACFYGYDNTPSSAPSLRVWGSWSANDDIDSYGGSADGNNDYTSGNGWDQVCHTFSTNQENWDSGEALIIQARLYSSSSGPDPTVYFVDLVEVTAPDNSMVNYPGGDIDGCTDSSACNYNAFATDDDGSCIYPTEMSIHDIQYTANQGDYCYESDYSGACVRTTGTVTAESPEYNNFYIQDESSSDYAGIYVHNYSSPPILGQNITITAMVNEYYSLTQLIDGASFSTNSSGNSVNPTDISTGDLTGCTADGESVESMLVRVNNIVVTTPSNEYGEWYVDDGSGPCKIDGNIFDGEWLEPSSSQEFASITGVVDYAYSEFSIFPRTMSDIILCATCPVADAGDNQTVAPDVLVLLDGSNSFDPNGSIIAFEWQQLSGIPVTLTNDEAESTTFIAPASIGDLVFKLTVYDNDYNEATDEITITVGTCTSISDIQFTTDQGTYCYETPTVGEEFNLCPAIVTHVVPESNAGSAGNFFISQSGLSIWGGIFVRDFNIAPSVGDEIDLTATVNEYYSLTQLLDVSSFSIISTGNSVIPLSIETGDLGIDCSFEGESYEGTLIRLNNITVESIDEFGNIQINDGSGPTLMDDYYFDGSWPSISIGDNISSIVGNVSYSYSEFKIYPRNIDDFGSCVDMGDLNGDGGFNVLDVVALVNCVLANNCLEIDNSCAGDLNGDGGYNVLDVVVLVNCVLDNNCGGRVDDASHSKLIIEDKIVSIEADGFIGGVQMTLTHGSDFNIDMTDRALFADYLTNGNETRLLVINPETEDLFSYSGNFEISEIIVANTQYEVTVDLPTVSAISLSEAYPNPFNPITTMDLIVYNAGNINVIVYNIHGQIITTLLNGYQPADIYTLTWDATDFSSGMYFIKAQAEGFTSTQKLMLIK